MPGDLAVLAGPDALGRSLIVGPGQAAPAPWADAPRDVVDQRTLVDPTEVVAELQARWSARERFVVELSVDLPDGPTEVEPAEPWTLAPDHTFLVDQLAHLVRANAVDLRDPGAPSFAPRSRALARGPRRRRPPTSPCPTAGTPGATAGRWTSSWPARSARRWSRC